MRHTVRLALVLTAASALAACGGNKAANSSVNNTSANSMATMPANDSSAVETMTPAPTMNTPAPMPMPSTTTNGSSSTSMTPPPPVVDTKTAPGGDMGGNSAGKQTPGM